MINDVYSLVYVLQVLEWMMFISFCVLCFVFAILLG